MKMSCHVSALDFSCRRARQHVGNVNLLGNFEISQALSAKRHDLRGARLAAQYDGRMHFLTVLCVGHTKAYSLCDFGMLVQRPVNLDGRDLFTASIDELLDASREREIAVFVEGTLVPCAKVSARECLGVRIWIVVVSMHNVLTAYAHFPFVFTGQSIPLLIQNSDLDSGSCTDRAGLADVRWTWVRCHLMSGFRHPVGFEHRRAEAILERGKQGRRKSRAARPNETEAAPRSIVLVSSRKQDLVNRRDRGIPGCPVLRSMLPETRRGKAGRNDHLSPRMQRRE